uniref:SCO-spondin-like n=1 Tax=Saccoglossus kowalevskii TaxID=10224 RepID=A0ABM0M4G2_SACKO|nr:PREDICTED: SCO-spondin-like [Saccoglossus kowalevskii]
MNQMIWTAFVVLSSAGMVLCKVEWSNWETWSECSVICGRGERFRGRLCLSKEVCPGEWMEVEDCLALDCAATGSEQWNGTFHNIVEVLASLVRDISQKEVEYKHSHDDLLKEQNLLHSLLMNKSLHVQDVLAEQMQDVDEVVDLVKGQNSATDDEVSMQLEVIEQEKKFEMSVATEAAQNVNLQDHPANVPPQPTIATDNKSDVNQENMDLLITNEIWSDWDEWSQCSVSCGVGMTTRRRICKTGPEETSEYFCPGKSQEEMECDKRPCREHNILLNATTEPHVPMVWQIPAVTISPPPSSITEANNQVTNIVQWDDWGEWSQCSVHCGTGFIRRYRVCQIAFGSTAECIGDVEQTLACNEEPCDEYNGILQDVTAPENNASVQDALRWSEWGDWSQCSVTCGTGNSKRNRTCQAPLDFDCIGDSEDIKQCTKVLCNNESLGINILDGHEAVTPEYENWGEWSEWSECPLVCDTSFMRRHRVCQSSYCSGDTEDITECFGLLCDGGWSPWNQYTPCCDGIKERRRLCDNPVPQGNGEKCIGIAIETRDCDEDRCDGKNNVDGGWSTWTSWTLCCEGVQERHRECNNPIPDGDGSGCYGDSLAKRNCDTDQCNSIQNQGWSDWGTWKVCCDGIRERSRFCTNTNGICEGHMVQTENCETDECNNQQTALVVAKTESPIPNHKWSEWSSWSPCSSSCGFGNRTRSHTCINSMPIKKLLCEGASVEVQSCRGNDSSCHALRTGSDMYVTSEDKENIENARTGFFGILLGVGLLLVVSALLLIGFATYWKVLHKRGRKPYKKVYKDDDGDDFGGWYQ